MRLLVTQMISVRHRSTAGVEHLCRFHCVVHSKNRIKASAGQASRCAMLAYTPASSFHAIGRMLTMHIQL